MATLKVTNISPWIKPLVDISAVDGAEGDTWSELATALIDPNEELTGIERAGHLAMLVAEAGQMAKIDIWNQIVDNHATGGRSGDVIDALANEDIASPVWAGREWTEDVPLFVLVEAYTDYGLEPPTGENVICLSCDDDRAALASVAVAGKWTIEGAEQLEQGE